MLIQELHDYVQQYENIKTDAEKLLAGLTDEQFNQQPAPGSWSIAECLDHLNVSGNKMLPLLDDTIENARAKNLLGNGPFKYGFLSNWFVRSMEPPAKFKAKAPKIFVPAPNKPLHIVLPEFTTLQDNLIKRVEAANGLDLAKVKITSLVSSLVKLSLGQWLLFIAAHERRHLWQAWQVRKNQIFSS